VLALTPAGQQHLATAAQAVRDRLAERLADWDDGDIATFAQLVTRFNQSKGDRPRLDAY
jgi:DNA-binding MarR family transcriptional regulator